MFVFKDIDKSTTVIEQNVVNYTHNFTTSSLTLTKIASGSSNTNYWNSLNVLFYTSASSVYGSEDKFSIPSSNLSINHRIGKQYLSKFHNYSSSSLISIPQQYYGEKIKKGSFTFIDLNNTDNDGNNPTIRDDGFGNLYSTNANSNFGTLAAYPNSSISSSDNYVGNIFYDKGLVLITETGSWSGSIDYSDLGTNFKVDLDSSNTIYSYEYSVTVQPNEYNHSTNYTLRSPVSGSLKLSTPYLATDFTGSDFTPYITTIKLYKDGVYDEPVVQARLPKPIKKSKKIATTFKIKLDL